MKVRVVILYGTLLCLLWSTENVRSVILTSTLITGFMGGYLIGRMNLGTFVNLLANNGSVLPSLSSLFPREEQQKAAVNSNPMFQAALPFYVPTPMTTLIGYHGPSGPYYHYSGAGMVPTNQYQPMMQPIQPIQVASVPVAVAPSRPVSNADLTIHPMTPVDVPISLDNKIRERFINQLALIDPLNCLPKIFCEVSADPYGTAVAIDHGTIAAVQPSSNQASISLQELEAYEMHLNKQTTTTSPTPTTESTTASTVNEDVQNDKGDSEEDDESGSDENDSEEDDIDDSFEQYRKEEEHKLEMQALEEMAEDLDDPRNYYFILKDKKRRKEKRKKYREKQKKHEYPEMEEEPSSFRLPEEEVTYLRDEGQGQGQMFNYDEPDPSQYINRRFSSEPPGPPMPPPLPPRPPLFMPSPMQVQVTEHPLSDMFADDPFFDGFSANSGRRMRQFSGMFRRRGKRQAKDDLMQNYRVAYKVAEKYRSPDMCRTVFPTCPYQTKTILRVVNRMESGLLPFNLGPGDKSNGFKDKNKNIDQFKNTLVAIERLNKAALAAHARGEPLDLQKILEAAASPSIKLDANTSKNIIKEFQEVVSKIKTAKPKKAKKKKKKNKKKERNNYDAVHYYKKAQMEALKPKERITPNPLKIYDVKKNVQDDEVQITRRKWEQVPSFKQTYHDMFKIAKTTQKPSTLPPFTTTLRPKQKPGTSGSGISTIRPIKKFSEGTEDDETDAKESEDRIYAMISQAKPDRSPIV